MKKDVGEEQPNKFQNQLPPNNYKKARNISNLYPFMCKFSITGRHLTTSIQSFPTYSSEMAFIKRYLEVKSRKVLKFWLRALFNPTKLACKARIAQAL